jgi:hypothetical protein
MTEAEKLAALDRAATQEADDIAYYGGRHTPNKDAYHAELVRLHRAGRIAVIEKAKTT